MFQQDSLTCMAELLHGVTTPSIYKAIQNITIAILVIFLLYWVLTIAKCTYPVITFQLSFSNHLITAPVNISIKHYQSGKVGLHITHKNGIACI